MNRGVEPRTELIIFSLEFNWKAEGEDMFTSVMYRHYNAPPGFNFDRRGVDPPMVRNPQSPEYNIPERVEDFVSYLEEQVIPVV